MLFSTIRGRGLSPARSRLRPLLIAAQVAVSLALMIAGSMLIRSAIHAPRMNTGYDGGQVVDLSLKCRRVAIISGHRSGCDLGAVPASDAR